MHLSRTAGLILVCAALIGCSDTDPAAPDRDVAVVVIANTASGTADVDVEVTGLAPPIALDLDFGFYTSQCALLPAEEPITISFSTGETLLASEGVTLEDGQRYTILLTSDGASEHVLVLEDAVTVAAGQRAVRLVNATAESGDVYLFREGEDMGEPAAADLAYTATAPDAPAYLLRDAGEDQVRLFDPDVSTGTPRAEQSLPDADIAPITTVIFAESEGGTAAFVLGPCGG